MKKILYTFLICLISYHGWAQDKEADISFDPNFVHSVYFWLHNPDSPEDRQAFETALKKLLETSRYTKTNYIGIPPKAMREVVDDSFTYKLVVTFESAEAQELYQNEDVHLQFIEDANHLWRKVIVYDAVELKK